MIEKIVLDYLSAYFADEVTVHTVKPKNKNPFGGSFIVIEKTGSSLSNTLKSSVIAVQSYAPSLYEAAELNEMVKAAMLNIITLDDITRCALNSDYNFTDEDTKEYRYQAVFNLTHY